jgi:hypothetical protein
MTALMDSVKADHGYNMDSKSVKNLLQAMSELSLSERRDFLQFTTGSPKLPIGGMYRIGYIVQWRARKLTIVRFPELDSYVYGGVQTQRGALHVRRLPPERHDLRQLSQTTRLYRH